MQSQTEELPRTLTDLDDFTTNEVIETIMNAEGNLRRSRASLLIAIEQFHRRNLALSCGSKSTVAWLMRTLDVARSTAFELVHISLKLACFPLVFRAFQDAAISYSAVRLLLKYITPVNEYEFVEIARKVSFSELQRYFAGEDENDPDTFDSFFRLRDRSDGGITGEFSLAPAEAAKLKAALKIGELSQHRDLGGFTFDSSLDDDALNDALDQALGEVQGRIAHDPDVQSKGEATDPPINPADRIASRTGDVPKRKLLNAFQGILNIVRSQPISKLRAPAAMVNILMSEDGHAHLPNQRHAPAKSLQNMIANAVFRLSLLDSHGLVINVGRAQRIATNAQVNALLAAWGHQCAAPGCPNDSYIEINHINEWSEGGATDMENLIPLCSGCHSMVTEGLLVIEVIGDEIFFAFADGSIYVAPKRSTPEKSLFPDFPPADLVEDLPDYDDCAGGFDDTIFDDTGTGAS